jgi:hypothetical protein
MLYFLEVTTAAFVTVSISDLIDVPERRCGVGLALAVSALAGGLAWLAESASARRERRLQSAQVQQSEAAAVERRRLVERARS